MTIYRYDPTKDGLERWFGPLEAILLDHLWAASRYRTLRQVCFSCANGRSVTTIQTTLNRLCEKGVLRRHRDGTDYRYEPVETRDAFEARQEQAILDSLGVIEKEAYQ